MLAPNYNTYYPCHSQTFPINALSRRGWDAVENAGFFANLLENRDIPMEAAYMGCLGR